THLNTPYPSTAYITGLLRSRRIDAVQDDLALALVLRMFSAQGITELYKAVTAAAPTVAAPVLASVSDPIDQYRASIAPVIAFLQGRDTTLAHRIVSRRYLPEGPRFDSLDVYFDPDGGDPLGWAFGALGVQDRARHFATLYLNDLADVVREAVDPRFEFVRYAESLAQSQASFEPLATALAAPLNLIDEYLDELVAQLLARHTTEDQALVVLLSVPFPGSVYAAFRIAQTVKRI